MLSSNPYFASQFLALGVTSYLATVYFRWTMMRLRYYGGTHDVRLFPPVVRIGKWYNYYLFLPLSTFAVLGASLFLMSAIRPNPGSVEGDSFSFFKYHVAVPISTGLLSFIGAAFMIVLDQEQSGPAAAVCGLASGAFGFLMPLVFQLASKLISSNLVAESSELACLTLAPMVLLCLLWGRAAASD